uniref:Uncharacterized protein n=1 Tax=Cacopsylla melanoneura TaxID=428564 RepID=A0A8D8V499_9HEMI
MKGAAEGTVGAGEGATVDVFWALASSRGRAEHLTPTEQHSSREYCRTQPSIIGSPRNSGQSMWAQTMLALSIFGQASVQRHSATHDPLAARIFSPLLYVFPFTVHVLAVDWICGEQE